MKVFIFFLMLFFVPYLVKSFPVFDRSGKEELKAAKKRGGGNFSPSPRACCLMQPKKAAASNTPAHTRKKRTGKFYKPGGVFLAPFKGGGEGEGLRHMCLVFKKPKVFGGDVYLPYTVERSNNGRSSWDFCCFGSLSALLI